MKPFSIIFVALLAILGVGTAQRVASPNLDGTELVQEIKKCLGESDGQSKITCVGDALGAGLVEARERTEAVLNTGDQMVVDFFKDNGQQVHEFLKNKQARVDKAAVEKADAWFHRQFTGRDPSWYPTPAEIQLAKKVKICTDGRNKENPTSCLTNLFGEDVGEVDFVRLDAINKHAVALEQIKGSFEHHIPVYSIEEFVKYKKQRPDGNKQRPQTRCMIPTGIPSAHELVQIKRIVLGCLEAAVHKDIVECAMAFLGTEIQDYIELIQAVIELTDPEVIAMAKDQAEKVMKMLNLPGMGNKIKEGAEQIANKLKEQGKEMVDSVMQKGEQVLELGGKVTELGGKVTGAVGDKVTGELGKVTGLLHKN